MGIHKWGNYREMDQEGRYKINKIGGWGNIGELRNEMHGDGPNRWM